MAQTPESSRQRYRGMFRVPDLLPREIFDVQQVAVVGIWADGAGNGSFQISPLDELACDVYIDDAELLADLTVVGQS